MLCGAIFLSRSLSAVALLRTRSIQASIKACTQASIHILGTRSRNIALSANVHKPGAPTRFATKRGRRGPSAILRQMSQRDTECKFVRAYVQCMFHVTCCGHTHNTEKHGRNESCRPWMEERREGGRVKLSMQDRIDTGGRLRSRRQRVMKAMACHHLCNKR